MQKPRMPLPSDYPDTDEYHEAFSEYIRQMKDYYQYEEYLQDRRKDAEAERKAEEANDETR